MARVLVLDGQGGKIGALLVKKLKETYPEAEIAAIGTNSIATAAMMKAGANLGATGENPIIRNAPEAGLIMGPMGIIVAHAIMGEVTPAIAAAVGGSRARKILIPVASCGVSVAGTEELPLSGYIQSAVKEAGEFI